MKHPKNRSLTERLTPIGRVLLCSLLSTYVPPWSVRAASPKLDEDRVLPAIALVETGTTRLSRPCKKIGKAGERGAWQMKRIVWQAYTAAPFERASTDAALAHLIATMHLRFLRIELELRNGCISAFSLALAWHAGLTGMQDATVEQNDYAERVQALYFATEERR